MNWPQKSAKNTENKIMDNFYQRDATCSTFDRPFSEFLCAFCVLSRLKILSIVLLLVGAVNLRAELTPLDTNALATLAVQDHGRKKPFTTFAQETLLTMSGYSALPAQDAGARQLSAEEVILDLWFKPEGWDERPVIALNFLELKKKFGLPEDRKLFSYDELINQPALAELLDETQKLRQAGKSDDLTSLQKEAEHLGERLKLFEDLVSGQKETIVPNPASAESRWSPIFSISEGGTMVFPVQMDAFKTWYQAYRNGDIAQFNASTPQVVESLRAFAPQFYPSAATLQFEHHYMTLHPFRWAWIIYLFALVILLVTSLWIKTWGYRMTWVVLLMGLGFEVYGLACRIIISGRPPGDEHVRNRHLGLFRRDGFCRHSRIDLSEALFLLRRTARINPDADHRRFAADHSRRLDQSADRCPAQ